MRAAMHLILSFVPTPGSVKQNSNKNKQTKIFFCNCTNCRFIYSCTHPSQFKVHSTQFRVLKIIPVQCEPPPAVGTQRHRALGIRHRAIRRDGPLRSPHPRHKPEPQQLSRSSLAHRSWLSRNNTANGQQHANNAAHSDPTTQAARNKLRNSNCL